MITDALNQIQNELIPYNTNLIAVSKTKPVDLIEEAYNWGVRDFGENKPQELLSKYEAMPRDIRWHLIGHLQTNKVKSIIDKVFLIHSLDSIHLAEAIDKESKRKGIITKCLIEINLANEDNKTGFKTYEVNDEALGKLSTLSNIKICGLMGLPPADSDPEKSRPYFRMLKQMFVDIKNKNYDNISMEILSMGMSNDYLIAAQEGATYVRVGSKIFGSRV